MDNVLRLISLTRKAGKLEVGEEPTGAAARAHQAKLIVVAKDATENTYRRVRHFGDAGNTTWVSVPYTKSELGGAVGRTSCAMMAVMDMGLAAAIVRGLAANDPEKFGATMECMDAKAEKALQRQREKRQHEKNVRTGKYQAKVRQVKEPAVQGERDQKPPQANRARGTEHFRTGHGGPRPERKRAPGGAKRTDRVYRGNGRTGKRRGT